MAGIVIAILIIAALIFLIVLVVVYLYIKNRGEYSGIRGVNVHVYMGREVLLMSCWDLCSLVVGNCK